MTFSEFFIYLLVIFIYIVNEDDYTSTLKRNTDFNSLKFKFENTVPNREPKFRCLIELAGLHEEEARKFGFVFSAR